MTFKTDYQNQITFPIPQAAGIFLWTFKKVSLKSYTLADLYLQSFRNILNHTLQNGRFMSIAILTRFDCAGSLRTKSAKYQLHYFKTVTYQMNIGQDMNVSPYHGVTLSCTTLYSSLDQCLSHILSRIVTIQHFF